MIPPRNGLLVRVLSRKVEGPGSVTDAVTIRAPHHAPEAVVEAIRQLPPVTKANVVPVAPDRMLGFVTCRGCSACAAIAGYGCFVVGASSSAAGALRVTLLALDRRALVGLLGALRAHGCTPTVEELRAASSDEVLSGRQREVLEAALELGFFEEPRRVQLGDLARRFQISKPTVRDILRRAVLRVLKSQAGGDPERLRGAPP